MGCLRVCEKFAGLAGGFLFNQEVYTSLLVTALLEVHVLDENGQRHDVESLDWVQVLVFKMNVEMVLVSHNVDTVADAFSSDGGGHVVLGISGSENLEVNILATALSAKLTAWDKGSHLCHSFLILQHPGRESTPGALLLVNPAKMLSRGGLDQKFLSAAAAFGGTRIAQVAARTAARGVGTVEGSHVLHLDFVSEISQIHLKRRYLLAALPNAAI